MKNLCIVPAPPIEDWVIKDATISEIKKRSSIVVLLIKSGSSWKLTFFPIHD